MARVYILSGFWFVCSWLHIFFHFIITSIRIFSFRWPYNNDIRRNAAFMSMNSDSPSLWSNLRYKNIFFSHCRNKFYLVIAYHPFIICTTFYILALSTFWMIGKHNRILYLRISTALLNHHESIVVVQIQVTSWLQHNRILWFVGVL